jgi:hypothetical protein
LFRNLIAINDTRELLKSIMSNKKENQHFVPKFYLRNFSWEGNKGQVGVFNIKNNLFIPQARLKTQAYKKNYYGKDGYVEDELSKVESTCSILISKILSLGKPPDRLTNDHRSLLFFVMLSILRNPIHENTFNELTKKTYELIYPKATEEVREKMKGLIGIENTSTIGLSHIDYSGVN